MPFPSTLSSFNRPAASDRLNSPSHSALHNTVSSAVGQIEQVIGLSTTSVLGSLFYDIRSPDSNGGGHVQTANKGGTGQTSYSKGELLVASSTSVLSKLAAGLDGQILQANSSVASGVNWGNPTNNKIAVSASIMTIGTNSVAEQSVMSVIVPGSTLGINNAVRARVFITAFGSTGGTSVMVQANYGATPVSSVLLIPNGNGFASTGFKGTLDYVLLANQSASIQRANLLTKIQKDLLIANITSTSIVGVFSFNTGSSTVDSAANQIMGITARFSTSDGSNGITINGYTVEKIV